ncbi:MAG: efflux RND transporter periplasmic adaptor subunit [Flavobacteriales bacterium]|nr:efflux RND transporter periplasmic adaptor subunit [Flavobacteriales bacterium]
MKKGLLGLLTLLVLCGCSDEKDSGIKAPIRVMTEIVSASTSANTQSYVGIVEESEATSVSFTSMGVVKRVLVSEGQTVGRGQLIAEMDDTQARNLLSGAEAQMSQANDALKRYKMLYDNGSLPEVKWVEVQSKVAQAKSQLEIAQKNLKDCKLTAPVAGIIGKKMVGAGETALPSQTVVTILDISNVKVKVAIPEVEMSGITANTPTMIKVEAANKEISGGKIEKGIQADALTHTYDIRINVQNDDRKLLPGMVANVSLIPTNDDKNYYNVPITSVQKKVDGSLFVWVVDKDNTAHRQAVSIGDTMGNRISITHGINSGDRIVIEGYQKLSEGTKVVY